MSKKETNIFLLEKQKKRTMHIVHGIVSLVFWPWLIVWLLCYLLNNHYNSFIDLMIEEEIKED